MLSDKRILEEMQAGNIVIEPYDVRQLGTNSYDLRLGQWYYKSDSKHENYSFDFTKQEDAEVFWGDPIDSLNDMHHSDDMRGAITVPAGSTILAHTEEVVGATNGFTTIMKGRSSTARAGLSVCKDAGVGDCGFISRWTMEISNHNQSPVIIHVGMRICQMTFYEIGETLKNYSGKYGSRDNWTPQDMNPKFFKDYDLELIQQKKDVIQ